MGKNNKTNIFQIFKISFLLSFLLIGFFGLGSGVVFATTGNIVTNPTNAGSVAFGGNITVTCSNLVILAPGAQVIVIVNGSEIQQTIPISNAQCSATVAVNQANNFNGSGANSINLWVSDSSGNQIASAPDVTESINTTNASIYACPSTGTAPSWTCSSTNSNTCADVTGCAAGTCTQVQVSQCGQPVSSGSGSTSGAGMASNSSATLYNPIQSADNLTSLLINIMKGFLGVIGILAVVFIVIGGFEMVVSSGNEEAVTKAKKTIIWAVLGLAVAVLSFAIIAIVENLVGVKIQAPTGMVNLISFL